MLDRRAASFPYHSYH